MKGLLSPAPLHARPLAERLTSLGASFGDRNVSGGRSLIYFGSLPVDFEKIFLTASFMSKGDSSFYG